MVFKINSDSDSEQIPLSILIITFATDILQKEELKGYNSYVDHRVQFSYLMSRIQKLRRQLATYQFRIEFSY